MCCQLDLLVAPLCCTVDASNQSGPVDASEVAEYKGIPCLRLVCDTVGQSQVPGSVLLPGMPFEIVVLVICAWLHLAPVAVQDVLLGVDQPAAVTNCGLVQRVLRHGVPPFIVPIRALRLGFLVRSRASRKHSP